MTRMARLTAMVGIVLALAPWGLAAQAPRPSGAHSLTAHGSLSAAVYADANRQRELLPVATTAARHRTARIVIGAFSGLIIGGVAGWELGRAQDNKCGPDCGGPKINAPADALLGAVLGAVIGGIVGAHSG